MSKCQNRRAKDILSWSTDAGSSIDGVRCLTMLSMKWQYYAEWTQCHQAFPNSATLMHSPRCRHARLKKSWTRTCIQGIQRLAEEIYPRLGCQGANTVKLLA